MTMPLRFPEFSAKLKAQIQKRIDDISFEVMAEGVDPQPLAPMTLAEGRELLKVYGQLARERTWTADEQFKFEQLISVFQQAVQAYARGYKGRWLFMSEEQILRLEGME